MKAQITGGNWLLNTDWEEIIKINAKGAKGFTPIADVLNPINTPDHSEMQIANAKLIANAPEMLRRIDAVLTSMRATELYFNSGVQKEKFDYWFKQLELSVEAL